MLVQVREVVVKANGQEHKFVFMLHKAERPEEQMIEQEFYLEHAKKIHDGVHFEMEVTESPTWGRKDPEVPIHMHQNPTTSLWFVCFTGQLGTLEAALAVIRLWVIGTVYAIVYKEDFAPLHKQFGRNFAEVMAASYDVKIVKDKPTLA